MGNSASRQFGPFLIDIAERVLRRDGETVPITPKAFDVLVALLEKPGQVISKEELLQKVWPDTFVEESNLSYNVFALRKALETRPRTAGTSKPSRRKATGSGRVSARRARPAMRSRRQSLALNPVARRSLAARVTAST